MEKSINYLARDFEAIKSELISFCKKYYPEMADNFNDSSVGTFFIDLVSAVGDNLNYHIDRTYQETNINSANMKSSLLNLARNNNVRVPGPKASICEVKLTCTLPIEKENGGSISSPNWAYSPIIKRGSIVGNGIYEFETVEDCNFAEQFNTDGVSNRTFMPLKDTNGVVTAYTVTKSVMVSSGRSRIYRQVITENDLKPFMEIILPDVNIMNVESIIFKQSANVGSDPQSYEYYIDEEEYRVVGEAVNTYRFFEVDALSDQFRLGVETRYAKDSDGVEYIADEYNPTMYDDYTETIDGTSESSTRTTRYYRAQWKPITQKFLTEYTDKGFLKITFGASNGAEIIPSNYSSYAQYIASRMVNNEQLGVLPKAGWTMFIRYRIGGGIETNLAPDSINSIINMNMVFPSPNLDASKKGAVSRSVKVTNSSYSLGGKDAPSEAELKYLIKYTEHSQNRCVTIKDYKARILQMPPKFGAPYRCNAIEDNNKIVIPMLGLNAQGQLDSMLPQRLVENIKEYLTHYKSLGDFIEMKSGRIYNLGFEVNVFIDKNYTTSDVITSIINKVADYMSVDKHDMGEDIFVGDLEKEINLIDGVVSLIELKVYNIYGGTYYSGDRCPLPKHVSYNEYCGVANTDEFSGGGNGSEYFRIGLDLTDQVLSSEYDSMYEVKYPTKDIIVTAKLR